MSKPFQVFKFLSVKLEEEYLAHLLHGAVVVFVSNKILEKYQFIKQVLI